MMSRRKDLAKRIASLERHSAPSMAFVRIARVKEISGLSKSTLWRWIKIGKFPNPVIREGNTVMWDLGEVMLWRARQFEKRIARMEQELNEIKKQRVRELP